MELTETERRTIAGRARTLHERLEGPANDSGGEPPIDPDRILAEWRDRFPSEDAFRERLDRDGFTEEAVREQLSATEWPAEEPLPAWLGTVEDLLDHVASASPETVSVDVESEEIPFSELLAALAEYARGQLPDAVVPVDTVSPMCDWLVTQLKAVCLRPLYVEFKSFVEAHDPELVDADPAEFSDPPTARYEAFLDAMFELGFKNLCLEYPVLARHAAQLIDQWVEAVAELFRRVRSDSETLRERFGVDGEVVAVEPLADDSHASGRVPVRVSFESGAVVYKPRPVDGGVTFYTILGRLDDHLSISPIETPTYVSRDEYGWMEQIDYSDLPDEPTASRYYERAGALLCLAYVLNFPDGQLENLVVDGTDPMLVDCETIFHPHVAHTERPLRTEISALTDRSVLFTSLLPWSQGDPREEDDESFSAAVAGFGNESERTRIPSLTQPTIEATNTDVMSVRHEPVEVGVHTNTPTVEGSDQPPSEYVDEICRGFDETYETIRKLHAEDRFLSAVVTPEMVAGVENRLVYRSTVWYRSVQQSAVARNPLRDGARLSVEFEDLAVPFFDGRIETDRYWPLYGAERRALRRRDIPRLSSGPDRRTVSHDGTGLGFEADTSGYDRCRRRLDGLSATDKHRQTWLIREIFDASEPRTPAPPADDADDEEFRRAAVELFEETIEAGIETADGTGWVSVSSGYSDVSVVPADSSLYWGRGGIALTAAALHRTTGRERYRRIADEALAPIVADTIADELSVGLGGTKGVGAVVYALSVTGELLDEERYRNAASKAARTVTDDRLSGDDTFDVMEGSAGTLLGLLAHYERDGESSVLDRAVACGERLLEGRVEVDGHRIWNAGDDEVHFTGFAHGTSGIAYSLARLSAATGDSRFADAVRETLDFESSLYSASRCNWRRSAEEDEYLDRWCHGRSGMALARIGIGECLGDDALRTEGAAALAETATGDAATIDNLCCGNFGRVETLVVGARRADGDRTDAVELARRCLARREQDGALSLPGHARSFTNPTFFDGVSGAAYALLRVDTPELPCVLLFE
ncbi:type 2 lanthipeptide synthetase LanM family protein [Halorussus lipolyticus]|uniref:type 2 lanthipeptide synthetase LanM family protein n=1 Tax=Halorussus lipolyticus TaxID=3034024 RepID=UPI0023E825CC|nr:type 2 lanthipeptide synthetase LanM family protein [Halorussus sp. DT80]